LKGIILDRLNLFRNATPYRLVNGFKIYAGYQLSNWLKRPYQWGLPVSTSIEPTTSCNLRCPECPSGLRSFNRPTGMMSFDLFKKTIDEQYRHLIYLLLYFQGEPYLNPEFIDFVRYAKSKRIYTATSTNGHYLNDENAKLTIESGLDRLIVSIDGTTQSTYEQYRIGGKLDAVIEGTKRILKWKQKLGSQTPYVIFQFLVVKPNEHQITYVKQLAKDIGVDKVSFKTAQIYDYQNGSPLIPDNPKYSRYEKTENGQYRIKNKLKNHCWKMWHSNVITWDGKVVPCCFDKDAQHSLGNSSQDSMKDIWNNDKYKHFRRSLLKSRKEIDICQNCTEGMSIWK